ncbi:MAG: hypothetical protein DRN99_06365 [Thermoproteota archaeon]|nr:MAG: hypothetical protein DRN99_06365 [Candidatus Korarchaeota archaeon]
MAMESGLREAREALAELSSGKVVSDGDLDGILASGLLSRALNVDVEFPSPGELRGLRVEGCILVELPPSKGLEYRGRNILLDHHEYSGVVVFEGSEAAVEYRAEAGCVADIAVEVFELELPAEGLEVLEAVRRIDQGRYESWLDRALHRAYRLEIASKEMRYRLLEWVRSGSWSRFMEWARSGDERWRLVEEAVRELKLRARELARGAVYFTYDGESWAERAAMREAMLQLEEEHPVVVAVEVKEGKAAKASLATKAGVDLQPAFARLREMGYSAGGRSSVGGAQLGVELEKALKDIKEALALL